MSGFGERQYDQELVSPEVHMTLPHSPTVRRRRIATLLNGFVHRKGLTAAEVARRAGISSSKISRILSNDWRLPDVGDVLAILDVCEVHDVAIREAMRQLCKEAKQRGWWEQYSDVLGDALPGFEAEASDIYSFQGLLIPGLLQTADYAAAVFKGGQIVDDDELIKRHVEARLARQWILEKDKPTQLWAVLDEAALTRRVGGINVMRSQLRHLGEMAGKGNIVIQVLPFAVGAYPSMVGPFAVLKFASDLDPDLVYLEVSASGDLFLEGEEATARYRKRHKQVCSLALGPADSAAYIDGLIKQLK